MAYRYFRDALGFVDGDRRIDPIYMGIMAHHCLTDEDRRDMIAFAFERGGPRALPILLRHLGRRLPLLTPRMTLDTWADKQIKCIVTLDDRTKLEWRENVLMGLLRIPETVAAGLPGQSVGALVEHPYVPIDLVIDTFEMNDGRWKATFRAEKRRRRS